MQFDSNLNGEKYYSARPILLGLGVEPHFLPGRARRGSRSGTTVGAQQREAHGEDSGSGDELGGYTRRARHGAAPGAHAARMRCEHSTVTRFVSGLVATGAIFLPAGRAANAEAGGDVGVGQFKSTTNGEVVSERTAASCKQQRRTVRIWSGVRS